MFVKVLILGITITLLANEQYNFINKLSSRVKKIILLSIIGLLTLLSIFDIYNDNEYYKGLKQKADETFEEAEKINQLQNTSHQTIVDSKKEISDIDSVLRKVKDTLSTQVNLLNQAVNKSKELLSIEKNRFDSNRPLIYVNSFNIKVHRNLSNPDLIDLHINILNNGGRIAEEVSSEILLLGFKQDTNSSVLFYTNTHTLGDLLPGHGGAILIPTNKSHQNIKNSYEKLILIIKGQYNDKYSSEQIGYESYLMASDLETDKLFFWELSDQSIVNSINQNLKEKGHFKFLINSEKIRGRILNKSN